MDNHQTETEIEQLTRLRDELKDISKRLDKMVSSRRSVEGSPSPEANLTYLQQRVLNLLPDSPRWAVRPEVISIRLSSGAKGTRRHIVDVHAALHILEFYGLACSFLTDGNIKKYYRYEHESY